MHSVMKQNRRLHVNSGRKGYSILDVSHDLIALKHQVVNPKYTARMYKSSGTVVVAPTFPEMQSIYLALHPQVQDSPKNPRATFCFSGVSNQLISADKTGFGGLATIACIFSRCSCSTSRASYALLFVRLLGMSYLRWILSRVTVRMVKEAQKDHQ